jgi:UDP-N-acetylglucosamine 2-epimerase (non-hydrolysing)
MKLMCVVGARPNFMKAAPVIEALRRYPDIHVMLVHTGQHYDHQMSTLFFVELGMPKPDVDLQVGSGSHGEQTGQIMMRIEPLMKSERPDLVIVFGDVNSTIAAALCAAKLGIQVAHVEAGLRSFDRTMPEELNRILTDNLSDFLFTTEQGARKNLIREGIAEEKMHFVGNVMVDTLLKHRTRAGALNVSQKLGMQPGSYGLLTIHRPSNVDDERTLSEILEAIDEVSKQLTILFPCHPRTRQRLNNGTFAHLLNVENPGRDRARLVVLDPLGYLEFLSLMADARLVMTDSGGIQEETTVLGVPCLTLRHNTERPVTVEQGTNVLVGNSRDQIVAAAEKALSGTGQHARVPDLWDGRASERIAKILHDHLLLKIQ